VDNILVTGGGGFIGRHLVKKMMDKGLNVVVVDSLVNPNSISLRDPSFYKTDIRNKQALVDIIKNEKIESCIHLAALISVADSVREPASTIDVNVNGTASLLEACSECKVRNFILASTGAVYGEPKQFPIREEHVLDPLSPYGATKVAGEALAASYANCGKIASAISLRFFNVYGEGQSAAYAGVITKFAENLSKGLPPVIYGDGLQTRDFVYVGDVANAIMLALQAAGNNESGTFNVATGRSITINDLARIMTDIFELDMAPIHEEERRGDVKFAKVDISKAKNSLGYAPDAKLEDTLATLMEPQVANMVRIK
jgi:UDP-glucose 4-epimerase